MMTQCYHSDSLSADFDLLVRPKTINTPKKSKVDSRELVERIKFVVHQLLENNLDIRSWVYEEHQNVI